MKLNIPPIGQKDSRWARKRLGTGTGTIGNYGCLLVCHAMMLTYYGHEFLPDVLNEVYKTKNVFDLKTLINFWAAANVFGDITASEFYNCYGTPCDLSKIDAQLEKKQPVIALVDFSPTVGVQTHFVLIIGKTEDGHYLINDPWTGETYFFHAKYGEPARYIYGLRIYSGTPKNGISDEDKISDLNDSLKSCNEDLAKKAKEVSGLRVELETSDRDNKDLASQLLESRSERDKKSWEIDQLTAKVKTLAEEIKSLKDKGAALKQEKADLRVELRESRARSVQDLTKWEMLTLTISKFLKGRDKNGTKKIQP